MTGRRLTGAAALLLAISLIAGCSNAGSDESSQASSQGGGDSGNAASVDDTGNANGDVDDTAASDSSEQVADDEYAPDIEPGDFVSGIDHPFFPMSPGNSWVYEGMTADGVERVEVTVLDAPREVMGVPAVVVRDTATVGGSVVEDTFDWFAQDKDGNVWYLGEEVSNYEDGVFVDSEGAWEAGVDGALPGIIMWADPQPGDPYRQKYYAGQAEDMARVFAMDGEAAVPFGTFSDVLVTEEWTPLETGVAERKYYVRGVGLVLEEAIKSGRGRLELLRMTATE